MKKTKKLSNLQTLKPSNSPSDAATAEQPDPINARLVYQYRRAESAKGQFVREATAFGVMLMEAEKDILAANRSTAVERWNKQEKGKNGRYEGVLEGWIAENCPEIAYKTALSYKALAQKMVAMMGGPTPEVMAALAAPGEMRISYEPEDAAGPYADDVETVSEEVISSRERLFNDATSRRKLEQMYFDFMKKDEKRGRDGAGSSREGGDGAGDSQPLPKLTKAQAAERIWAGLMSQLDKTTVLDAIALLPPKVASTCYERMQQLTQALKAQMSVSR